MKHSHRYNVIYFSCHFIPNAHDIRSCGESHNIKASEKNNKKNFFLNRTAVKNSMKQI